MGFDERRIHKFDSRRNKTKHVENAIGSRPEGYDLLRVCGKIVERVQSIPIEPTDSGKGDF